MNPGKRRKLKKLEYLRKMFEQKTQTSTVIEVQEEPKVVQPEIKEEILEVQEINENVELQAPKKKKKTS